MQRPHSPILGSRGRRLLAGFLIAAAAFVLWVGAPRFLAELMLVPGSPTLKKINDGTKVTLEDLDALEQSRLAAIRFADLPQYHAELSTAYLARAQVTDDRQARLKYAGMAIGESKTSLEKAPLNPFDWARISMAEMMYGPSHYDAAIEAWRKSIELATFEPHLFMQRIHVGVLLYTHLGKEDIGLLKQQINLAFHWQRWIMRYYLRTHNLVMWVVLLSGPDSEVTAFLKKPQ